MELFRGEKRFLLNLKSCYLFNFISMYNQRTQVWTYERVIKEVLYGVTPVFNSAGGLRPKYTGMCLDLDFRHKATLLAQVCCCFCRFRFYFWCEAGKLP